MKLLYALLIPTLVVGQTDQVELSNAAKALLKKPRLGFADVTWRDGTHETTQIVRVTDHFVAVRQGGTCNNIELSRIAKVKWEEGAGGDESFDDFFPMLIVLAFPPALLVWLPVRAVKQSIRSHDSKLGSWESVLASHNQGTERVHFQYTRGPSGQGTIINQVASIRLGHYRFEEGRLYTRYDDDANNETSMSARIECDQILVGDLPRLRGWRAQHALGRVEAPLVGRWVGGAPEYDSPDVWEFRPDGTFQVEALQRQTWGHYKKTEGGVSVIWDYPTPGHEEWKIHNANGSLFITRDGKTTEFKRCAPF